MRIFSGEFVFKWLANGGTVVLLRSVWVTIIVYLLALVAKEVTDPNSIWWDGSWRSFGTAVYGTIPWAGAIFAGAYVAFYTRFSSQWAYLAGLYNQIMQTQCSLPKRGRSEDLDVWWAAFIEDAVELHLAKKPMFAILIRDILKRRPGVRAAFASGAPGGSSHLAKLEADVESAFEKSQADWKKRTS